MKQVTEVLQLQKFFNYYSSFCIHCLAEAEIRKLAITRHLDKPIRDITLEERSQHQLKVHPTPRTNQKAKNTAKLYQ